MSKYRQCPNCYGQKKGNSVKRCKDCGKVYCSSCERSSWTSTCPNCKSNRSETLGYIDPNA